MPPDANLPDGGELALYQKATGNIAGTETDTFTFTVDCRPGYGVAIVIRLPSSSQNLDIAYTVEVAGRRFEDDEWGPGEAEFATWITRSLSFPLDFVVEVYSSNGETGEYEIEIRPEPIPQS
jgi:hypothetical protein